METLLSILAGIGGVSTAVMAVLAWRARGEALAGRRDANDAAERARIAEIRTGAEQAKTLDADARAGAATALYKAADHRTAALLTELDRERREKGVLLEKLAKLGVPVGDVLVDTTLDRLYAFPSRREASGDPGADGRDDRERVPDFSSEAPTPTKPKL